MRIWTKLRLGLIGVVVLAVWLAGKAGATDLPVNQWTKLPNRPEPGYVWSTPVYAPGRGQLLHWGSTDIRTGGRLGFEKGASRNDVLAFDASTGNWTSDYPSDEKAAVGIAGVAGNGGMLPSGRPKPSHVMQGVCYDSRRDQVVYTMKGLMAAYDPKAKTWKDLGAKTVMPFPACEYSSGIVPTNPRTEFAGGPPVYAVGTCYDPVNDEILLFPHFDAKNIALRDATGQITGHYGTFRYSFKDNTWRLVSDTFGSDEIKKTRKDLIAVMTAASKAMDTAWILNRRPNPAKTAEAGRLLESAAGDCLQVARDLRALAKSGEKVAEDPVAGLLKAAAAALAANKPGEAAKPLRDALWGMNETLDMVLRVEPPARCGAPMVYDAKNKSIVMFGGYTDLARTDLPTKTPGVQDYTTGLDDTWVYDCATRQWRELPCPARPPASPFGSRMPMLAFDPESGLVLLVTLAGSGGNQMPGYGSDSRGRVTPTGGSGTQMPFDSDTGLARLVEATDGSRGRKVTLWTLDVAKREWSKRDEQDWPGGLSALSSGGGSSYPTTPMPTSMFGFDVKNRLLLVIQRDRDAQATYAMKLDLGKLAAIPAPICIAPPPVKPHEIPADDPAWVATLKALPANTWTMAKPPREPCHRAWGNLSVDPVRGWVVYFGGGHASYQVNDVAVYAVGANAWTTGVGEFNSYITPQGWEGSTLGYRGGPPAGHQRNAYQSFDGRMYVLTGSDERTPIGSVGSTWNYVFHADRDCVRFYDLDRGGIWRETRISTIERPDNVPNHPNVHMVDPAGRIVNLIRQPGGGMAGRIFRYVYSGPIDKFFTSIYDIQEDKLLVRDVLKPFPELMEGESRPFCYLAGQGKVFYMNVKPDDSAKADPKQKSMKQVTYLYDTRENKFSELNPARTPPPGGVQAVEYVENQKCVLAVIGGRQWVYSFEKNDWAELPLTAEGGTMSVSGPFGQLVWVSRYGVFVNLSGSTWVMRPDFSKVKWE
jgi:hypothetical protein